MPHQSLQDLVDDKLRRRQSQPDGLQGLVDAKLAGRSAQPEGISTTRRVGTTLGTEGLRGVLQTGGFFAGGLAGSILPFAGTAAGAATGGALAGAVSELPIQFLERALGVREKFVPGRILSEGAIGAIAPLRIAKGLGAAAKLGRAALSGARVSGTSAALTPIAEGEGLPTPQGVALGTALGTVAGPLGFKLGGRKFGTEVTPRGPESSQRAVAAREKLLAPTDIPPKPADFTPQGRLYPPARDEGLSKLGESIKVPDEVTLRTGARETPDPFSPFEAQGNLPIGAPRTLEEWIALNRQGDRSTQPQVSAPERSRGLAATTLRPGTVKPPQPDIDLIAAQQRQLPIGEQLPQGGRIPPTPPPPKPEGVQDRLLRLARGDPEVAPTQRPPQQAEPTREDVSSLIDQLRGRARDVPRSTRQPESPLSVEVEGTPLPRQNLLGPAPVEQEPKLTFLERLLPPPEAKIQSGMVFTEETTGRVGVVRSVLDDGKLEVSFKGAPRDAKVIVDSAQELNFAQPRRTPERAFDKTGQPVESIQDVKTGLRKSERGAVTQDLLADIATVGGGGLIGTQLNEENPALGALSGALLALGVKKGARKIGEVGRREEDPTRALLKKSPQEQAFEAIRIKRNDLHRNFGALSRVPLSFTEDVQSIAQRFIGGTQGNRGLTEATANISRLMRTGGLTPNAKEVDYYARIVAGSNAEILGKRAADGTSVMDKIIQGQAKPPERISFEIAYQSARVVHNLLRGGVKRTAVATQSRSNLKKLQHIMSSGDTDLMKRAMDMIDSGTPGRSLQGKPSLLSERLQQYKAFRQQGLDEDAALFKTIEKDTDTPSIIGSVVMGVRFSNMLSSIVSQERNALGAAANLFYEETVINPLTALRSGDTLARGEVAARIAVAPLAMARGIRDGLFAAKHGIARQPFLRHGFDTMRTDGKGNLETGTRFDTPRVDVLETLPLLKAFKYPGRGLFGMDQFFRGVAFELERTGTAYSKAAGEGLSGAGLQKRMAELVTTDDKIFEQATDFATRIVAQREGDLAQTITRWKVNHPSLNLVIPFVRTPADLLTQGRESSFLGFFAKEIRSTDPRRAARAKSRAIAGTTAQVAGAFLIANGIVTGRGPAFGTAEREQWLEEGHRPYSIEIPGQAPKPYQLMQPIAFPLAIMADGFEGIKDALKKNTLNPEDVETEVENLVAALFSRAGNSILSQSYFNSMFDLFTGVERGDLSALNRIGKSFILPAASRDVARVIDPTLREPRTFRQEVAAEIPFLSKTVPPRRTRFGEPIQREGSPLGSLFVEPARTAISPLIGGNKPQVDPLVTELAELGVKFGKRGRSFFRTDSQTGERRDPLTQFGAGEEAGIRNALQGIRGKFMRTLITQHMQTREFQNASVEGRDGKRAQLERIIRSTTRRANTLMDTPGKFMGAINRLRESERSR